MGVSLWGAAELVVIGAILDFVVAWVLDPGLKPKRDEEMADG